MKTKILLMLMCFVLSPFTALADSQTLSATVLTDDSSSGTVGLSNSLYSGQCTPSTSLGVGTYYALGSSGSGTLHSHYWKWDHFGFTIPTGSVIIGIVATTTVSFNNANVDKDYKVELEIGGTISSTNKAVGSVLGNTTLSYGGVTDLWGTTPTVSQINATNFGFAWSSTLDTSTYTMLDCDSLATITVYYTPPAISTSTSTALDYGSATTTNILLTDENFAIAIFLVLFSINSIAFIYNKFSSNKKKPWEK